MTRLSIKVRYVHDLFTKTTHKVNSCPGRPKFKRSTVTTIKHADVAESRTITQKMYDHVANKTTESERAREREKRLTDWLRQYI